MRYFKIIQSRVNEECIYTIILKNENNDSVIGKYSLDIRKNNDAFILCGIYKFDNNSVIEFFREKFKVKNWHVNEKIKEVQIWI